MSDEIKAAVKHLNEAWRAGRFEELEHYFHPDVVVAHPRFTKRMIGREALLASYKDFVSHATIDSFEPAEPQVDITGETAVSVCPWRIQYHFEGNRFDESGWDLMVWNLRAGRWIIVWRTVVLK